VRVKRCLLTAIVWVSICPGANAQGSAGTEGSLEPRFLIDVPTAGMLAKGSFALDLDFYQEGGVLLGLSVACLID